MPVDERPSPHQYMLRAEVEENDLNCVWSGDDFWDLPAYHAPLGLIRQTSEAIRELLGVITDEYIRNTLNHRERLVDVAKLGKELATHLFTSLEDSAIPETVKSVMVGAVNPSSADRKAKLRITVADSALQIPWGFVFLGELPSFKARLTADLSLASLFGLWAASFEITARYSVGSVGRLPAMPRTEPAFCPLFILHEDLFSKAAAHSGHIEELNWFKTLRDHGRVVVDWESCEEQWSAIAQNDSLVYIYGHSDGKAIYLQDNPNDQSKYVLRSGAFGSVFERSDKRPVSICILNGCRTLAPSDTTDVGRFDQSFLLGTHRNGFCGFIGTEAEVANDVAMKYGLSLLRRVCIDGESVGEAFDALQTDQTLFPMNLYYSCYANREFRVAKSSTAS